MRFLTAAETRTGRRKKGNQDAALVMQGERPGETVLAAAVCDGMGGLERGEAASAAMVRLIEDWFRNRLPALSSGAPQGELWREEWTRLADRANLLISRYGRGEGIRLGTTCALLFIRGSRFLIMNVGDSRVYRIRADIRQITRDHTYVQREVDLGRMTPDEAENDGRRSILLQCIGSGGPIRPDFFSGGISPGEVFLICSDGFRNRLRERELCQALRPEDMISKGAMAERIGRLIDLGVRRGEADDMSAVLVKTL